MSSILTPREEQAIKEMGKDVREHLDSLVLTSPWKAGLLGAAVGAAVALATKKPVPYYSLVGASVSALLASSHRFWYAAGYGCGVCAGSSSEVLCDSAAERANESPPPVARRPFVWWAA